MANIWKQQSNIENWDICGVFGNKETGGPEEI